MRKNTKSSVSSALKIILCFTFLAVGFAGFAQDKIVKKGGETLEVKILEISPNEIKYKLFNDNDGIVYIMDKDRVKEVIYENGRVEKYEKILTDAEFYVDQKKRALKLNLISPSLGYTQLAYEQNIKPGRSFEVSLGIIGLGARQELDYWNNSSLYLEQKGAFASFGLKFIRTPDFTTNNQKYGHIMQGLYVKPEIMIGSFANNILKYDANNIGTVERQTTTFGALMVNLGKQWVFSDIFIIDLYGGVGYALQGRTNDNLNNSNFYYETNYHGRLYGALSGSDDASFAMSGGFRIGILLK